MIKVATKRFWWFHRLFKTKTYRGAKALEAILEERQRVIERIFMLSIFCGEEAAMEAIEEINSQPETLH